MLFRNALISTAIVLLAAGFAANAFAQARKGDGPCAADAKKFCGSEKPGGGRIAKCMKSHEAELSPACQSEMKKAEERIEQVREECKGDVEKFCKGVKPGAGRILSCLKGREADLAPACAAEFKRAGKR
jgi:Cysteine rich repeat